MTWKSELADGLDELIEEMGSTWTWNGNPYQGIQGDQVNGADIKIFGQLEQLSFVVVFRRADFTGGIPAQGDIIKDSTNKEYRINQVVISDEDPGLQVNCVSKTE